MQKHYVEGEQIINVIDTDMGVDEDTGAPIPDDNRSKVELSGGSTRWVWDRDIMTTDT